MNQPLFTIVIPAYNGKTFLEKSIHSIVNNRTVGEVTHLFEVIVIDDGSTDNTTPLAKTIAKKWNKVVRKDFIKVITKKNGQYGSVINRAIKEAHGLYFKVLDVDDTFNTTSFIEVLYIALGMKQKPDVIFTDHVFEKVGTDYRDLQSLRKTFEPNKLLKFADQELPDDLITMHSIIYRTELLRKINYHQVEGVYYSDSQYSLIPMLSAKSMYYIQVPLYRYYIGRGEQSINLGVMVRNISHQRAVLRTIFEQVKFKKNTSQHLKNFSYMVMRRMTQWNAMLISNDKSIKNKRHAIIDLLAEGKELLGSEYKNMARGAFYGYITTTKGIALPTVMKYGIRIYAKFKKNIMAEWD